MTTSQKKIYNIRSILNLGIRKSALNRLINSINFDIFLKLCTTFSYLMGLKKKCNFIIFSKYSTLPPSGSATCENYATPIFL